MQIVVTDGYTLNPGDLSWELFHKLGDVTIYDRTPADAVESRCKNADILIVNKTPIGANVISAARNLKFIGVTATGFNIVDTAAASQRQIPVANVPAYGTDSVAQHTFSLLLELTNHVGKNSQSVSEGNWSRADDWSYSLAPIVEISGKTLGLVGYGRIGQKVASIAESFGMKVIYHSNSGGTHPDKKRSLEELFSTSDFISLHCPLTKDNQEFINTKLLSRMKPSAFLINTARGQLIHENDLRDTLQKKKIAGAALDVLSVEPPPPDHPLLGLSNCLITPHNAWLSFEARERIMKATLNNVIRFLEGAPVNIVNRF